MKTKNSKKRKNPIDSSDLETVPLKKANKTIINNTTPNGTQSTEDSSFYFNIKHFRKELNSSKIDRSGILIQFLNVCNKSNETTDYMLKYLQNGGTANEIIKQLEYLDQKDMAHVSTIFNLFYLALTKIQSSVPHQLQSTEDTCRYFLNTHVQQIEMLLSEKSNTKQQKIALKLLTSIVVLNFDLGVVILTQLPLTIKKSGHLIKYGNDKNKDGVRGSFVNFVTSFLIESDTVLIKVLLDKHGLLTSILPDLVKDNAETIITILHLMNKSILCNLTISKTLKIRTFNHNVISYIFNLYNWKKYSKCENASEVENSVSEFLEVLCSSRKYGICFNDKYLGVGDISANQYLWKSLELLDAPWNNKAARGLLIRIIYNSPDLFKPIRLIIEESLIGDDQYRHINSLIFFKDIIKELTASCVTKFMSEMNIHQIFNFIKNTYLPPNILKIIRNTLKSEDNSIRNEGIIILKTILECLKGYLKSTELTTIHGPKITNLLKNSFETILLKHFPSVDELIMSIHSILDIITKNNKTEIVDNTNIKSCFLLNILDLLICFDDILPNMLDPTLIVLDTKRLFEKIKYFEDNQLELKLKTTIFLLRADKFAFIPEKPLFKEVLMSMLEAFISHNYHETIDVLNDILISTDIFENELEINIILHALWKTGLKYKKDSSHMFINVIENIIMNFEKYKKLHKQYSNISDNKINITENYDELFMRIENYNRNDGDVFYIHNMNYLSFFVTGLLKCSDELINAHESFIYFSEIIIINLMHFQDNPEVLWNILKKFTHNSVFETYIFGWENNKQRIHKSHYCKEEILFKLSKFLLKDSVIDIEIFEENSIDRLNFNIILNMSLFYLFQQNRLNIMTSESLSNSTNIIIYLTDHLLSNDEFSTKDYVKIIGQIFSSSELQQKFTPLKKSNDSFMTNFALNMIDYCYKKNVEIKLVKSIVKPYTQKLFLDLKNEIINSKKIGKGFKYEQFENIISIIKLDFNDIVFLLNDILNLKPMCMLTEANEHAAWIQIICYALKNFHDIPLNIFNNIMKLYSMMIKDLDIIINLSDLEECFYNYLLLNPDIILSIPIVIFEDMFSIKHVTKFTSKLGSLLLQSNSHFVVKFAEIVVKEEILNKREFALPFASAALQHSKFSNSSILKIIFDNYKSNINKIIEKPQKVTQVYIDNLRLIIDLINKFMDIAECKKILKKNVKVDSVELFYIDLIEVIFYKTIFKSDDDSVNMECFDNFLLHILHMGTIVLKYDDLQQEVLIKLYCILDKLIKMMQCDNFVEWRKGKDFENITKNSIWQKFFKYLLMAYFKSHEISVENSVKIFNSLCGLVKLLYTDNHPDIVELFEMLTSHSEFLNIMLNINAGSIKLYVVKLIRNLLYKNKTMLKSSHIPVYLSAYEATDSETDNIILSILKIYENNDQSMSQYEPYLWGEVGANHYALRSNRKIVSLWSNPTVNHILNLFDKEKIETTIKHFPVNKIMISDHIIDIEYYNIHTLIDDLISINPPNFKISNEYNLLSLNLKLKRIDYEKELKTLNIEFSHKLFGECNNMYDVSFILTILNYMLTPGSMVSCHRIIRCGILAVPLMALSSFCPLIRASAYNVLYRFYMHLEAEMFYKKDKVLWAQFLNTLKSSLESIESTSINETSRNPQLSGISALYLARAALIMTTPLDPLFKPINNFIITKQYINFTVVPDFLDLFHSTDISYLERRIWILEIIRDGIKTFSDIKLLFKSVVFKILFDFYSCCLADIKVKVLIMEIINRVVCIPKAAKILTEGYGLLPWLKYIFRNLHRDDKVLISISVNIVYNLFASLMIDSTVKIMNETNVTDMLINNKCFKINESIHATVCIIMSELIDKLSALSANDKKLYLNTLCKISDNTIKSLSQQHLIKIIEECSFTAHIHTKYSQCLSFAIKNRNINLIMTSKRIIEQKINKDDNDILMLYLHEIIQRWL